MASKFLQLTPLPKKKTKLVLAGLMLTIAFWMTAPDVQAGSPSPVFVLLDPNSTISDVQHVERLVKANGGRITHTFPSQALIAVIPDSALPSLSELSPVLALFTKAVEPSTVDVYGPQARGLARVWNELVSPSPRSGEARTAAAHHSEPHHDALIAPDLSDKGKLSATESSIVPGYYQTSEFMSGSVAVGIVLLESNGTHDVSTENWTYDEKQLVISEIVTALNWWQQLDPQANLSFVYDDHFTNPLPTSVEPITRPYYQEQYWIGDAMNALGFNSSSYFTQVRDYDNYLRQTYQTDWAFTIFVVDSANDTDNKFSDGYFAYAYLGGPFMVMTSGNNGYGPYNMDAVAAHEMGHIFNALDQYYSAAQSCTRRSGYLDVENQNSQYGSCGSNEVSIMRGQIYPFSTKAIDTYAAGQIGWRDSDGDGIFDPLDTRLPVTIDNIFQDGNSVTVSGSTEIVPYPSPAKNDVTINTLTGVQYRVDGGYWQPATAGEGGFFGTSTAYSFTVSALEAGVHTLEVAATDSAGNISDQFATEWVAVGNLVDGGLNTELYPVTSQADDERTTTVEGVAYHAQGGTVARVEYRVDGDAWQPATVKDGAFDSNNEPFLITITAQPGETVTYFVEARAVDNLGHTEVEFAGEQIQVNGGVSQHYTTFLPLIIR